MKYNAILKARSHDPILRIRFLVPKNGRRRLYPGGGGLPYEEYMGVCHELGSYLQEKKSEKGSSIFHKNSGKGYNTCKKLQIGSVIFMAQMTNQKKTELIDYFHLVWTRNPQF